MITDSQKYDLLVKLLGPGDCERRGINAQFWCPFCDDPDTRKRKLAIRLADGLTHCWVCGWSARTPTMVALALKERELARELEKCYGEFVHRKSNDALDERCQSGVRLPSDFKLIGEILETNSLSYDERSCVEYLVSRGISSNVAWAFRLGVSEEFAHRRRIVFPSFDARGHLNYVTSRAIDDRAWPKYLNDAAERSSLIFNEIDVDWTVELTIVEGPFDLLSCHGLNAVAALGSWLDERHSLFEKIVMNQTPIVLAFDPDAKVKQEKVATKLLQYEVPVRVVDWIASSDSNDPGKLGPRAFRELVRVAKPYDQASALQSKFSRALDSVRL